MAKNKQKTVEEIKEQMRKNRFSQFTVGDDKEHHTVEEVKQAAIDQGLIKPPVPAENSRQLDQNNNKYMPNAKTPTAENKKTNPLDLRNQIIRTETETLPKIAQEAVNEYEKSHMGYDYLSRYGENTRYSDVSGDINRVQQLKGAAQRRDKNTDVYDRALEMLKSYAAIKYNPQSADATAEDKKAVYEDNKREISNLQNQLDAVRNTESNSLRYLNTDGTVADVSKSDEEKDIEQRISALNAQNSAYETALNNEQSQNKSVEELQKEIDAPQKTMDDIDLDDEKTVASYLNNERESVDFFMNYRKGNVWHDRESQERYQNLLNLIELKVNNANESYSRYSKGEEIGYEDNTGRKYNKKDYLIGRVAQNQISDINADSETAKNTLDEISAGNRDLTNEKAVSGSALKNAGWDVKGDVINYGKAYSSSIHDTAAVFSPVVYSSNGEIERILTPDELNEYAEKVLSGAADKYGLKMTDTYYGANAESLANENQQRIRRLSERYYNNTDLQSLIDTASQTDGAFTDNEENRKSAQEQLSEYGVNWDEIQSYQDLQKDREKNIELSQAYADWSTNNVGTAALATAGNIVASPVQAFEWLGNLADNITGHFRAGTNELSVNLLPNIDNDTVTNLSQASTGAITESIRSGVKGNGDNEFLNQMGDLAANTYGGVTSGLQSALTVATCYALLPRGIAEAASLAIMSGEAGNQAYHEVIDNGGTVGQAVTYSAASALNETLGEKISLDNMFSIIQTAGKQTAKEMLLSVMKQSLIEGSEEIVTENLNEFADRIINGDKSTYYRALQSYLDMGYSEDEATKKATTDFYERVLWAGYGGVVGGLIGAGTTAVGTKLQNAQYERGAGNAIASADNVQSLIDQANQLEGEERIKEMAQQVADLESKRGQSNRAVNWINEKKTEKKAGKLYAAMQESNAQNIQNAEANEVKGAIKSAYQTAYENETGKKADESDLNKAAEAIYKSEFTEEKLTRAEKKIVGTAAAQSAIDTVAEDADLIREQAQKSQERSFKNYISTAQLTQQQEQEQKSDDDVDIDEFNYHDDDGKVYTADGSEQVNIKSIAAVGANDVTVTLENGKTESIKNLDIPTTEAVLYKSVLDAQKELGFSFNADIANALFDGYQQIEGEKPSVSQYMQDAQTVLFNGYTGNTAPNNSIKLPQSLRNRLYSMGRQIAKTHTQEQQAAVKSRVKGNKTRTGTVTFRDGIKRSQLDARRRAGVDAVEKLAQSLGFDVVFYRSTKDGKGRFSSEYVRKNKFVADGQQAPSGFWRGGKMYLDINAGMNGEGLILFTASHELVHMIREGSPEDYKALADFLVQNYAEQGVDINDLVRKEMAKSTNLTRDQALEEVIAESCEPFLRDTTLNEKAQELYKQNPTLWSRIREALKRIVNAVKQTYSIAKPQSDEARVTMRAEVKTIETAYDLWTKGIIKSAENLRNMERESTDTKYQGRAESQDTEYLDAVERGDMATAQRMADEAAKAAGYDRHLYHGAKAGGGFTVFKGWQYFTASKAYAERYTQRDTGKGLYNVYVKSDRLFDTRKADDRAIFGEYKNEYGMGELQENGLPDWTDGYDLSEIIEENELDYDGIVLDEGGDLVDGKPVSRGLSYVIRDSSQVKSADPVTYDDNGDVIPLSQRFDTTKADIRYQSREDDLFSVDDMFDDDTISDMFAKDYAKHSEDIGEVLKNISDIELSPKKVTSIVNRVIRENLGDIDSDTRDLLSTEIQIALESVDTADPEDVSNAMIAAVRKAINNATVADEHAAANYKDFLSVFKGKRYFLTDEQIADLAEHDMTPNDFKKKMFGKINIVNRENAERSISGGYKNAQQLSLEGLYESLDSPDEYLPYRQDQWDEMDYHAPIILMDTIDNLKRSQTINLAEIASESEIDDLAVSLTAKITGEIVEAKYNSRKNPYVSKLVTDLRAQRTEAVQKQKEKNKKALQDLKAKERERAAKRELDLRQKYQDQRDNAREGRKRTELRHKIKSLTDSLQKRLTKPKGQQYVPRELIAQTVDVLNSINLDSGRSTRLSEKLATLHTEYAKLKNAEGAYAMYDPVIAEALLGVRDSVGNTPITKMTLSQLKQVYDVIRSMDYVIRESVKMTDTNFKKETHQIGRDWIAEIRAVPKEHVGILSGYVQTMLSAERFFNRIAGFKKNSTSSQLFDMLNKGQLAQTQYEMEFTQIFADLIQDKQLKSLYDTKNLVDIGLEDEDGNKVPITRGMMLSLYMHLLNEDNTRHVMGGGLTVPGVKTYYKGDYKKAFGSEQRSVRVGALDYSKFAEGLKSLIEEQLTDYEIEWVKAAQYFFDVASRKALNEITMKLYGFRRANVNNYFPIHTDSNYRAATFENITKDMSLENSGFMKERVKASNPILLEDITDVINDQISKVAKYCGMTLPIRNFQKVYGTTTLGFETSVQKELSEKFSASSKNIGATKYIDNLLSDLTGSRNNNEGFLAQMLAKARGNLAQATLTLNPRVAIAQTASIPTAAPVIGYKAIMKALTHDYFKVTDEEIAEITPLFWLRRQGYATIEIGDIKNIRQQKHRIQGKVAKAMNWINAMDSWAVRRLFVACKYYMQDNYKNLKPGTEEYNQKLSEVYNKVIEATQPNYTTLQRPDILRNPNAIVKSLTMFMTQRLQNFNIVYDSVGTYNKYLSDFKQGINGVTAADVKTARKTLVRSISSQILAAATIVSMKLAADVLLHSLGGYRDDDEELTGESIGLALLNNFADTIFGSVLFGSDLYSLVKSLVSGSRYYGISLSGIDSVTDALTNITNLRKDITLEKANKAAISICQFLGIPLGNAEKIGKAVYYWISDISSGDMLESGVTRTNKQNVHRYETKINSSDNEKAKEILNSMIEDKKTKGKTDKEAKSALRSSFTTEYKPRYIEANKNNNADEIKNIREILFSTGLYGSLSEQDKTLQNWLKDEK